jgi:hypothetical protein
MSQLTDPVTNRADKEGETKDAVSHYVLRLAYCRTDEVSTRSPPPDQVARVIARMATSAATSLGAARTEAWH